MTGDPGVDLIGGNGAGSEVVANGLGIGFCVGAGGGVEEEQDWGGLELHLCGCQFFCGIYKCNIRDCLTAWKVFFPSTKSNVPNSSLPSAFLSPFVQLLPKRSHSGWKFLHSSHPNLCSRAVKRTATE